jgi:hypothetical protein
VLFFNTELAGFLGSDSIADWLYLTPVSILLTGLYQNINYWTNRGKQYKRLAVSRVLQSGTSSTANLSYPFSGFSGNGLIFGGILGQVVATTVLGKLIYNKDSNKFRSFKRKCC